MYLAISIAPDSHILIIHVDSKYVVQLICRLSLVVDDCSSVSIFACEKVVDFQVDKCFACISVHFLFLTLGPDPLLNFEHLQIRR